MSYQGPKVFRDAVAALSKLPGIGEKTASRLVLHLVRVDPKEVELLSDSLKKLKSEMSLCSVCFGYTDSDPCPVCQDPSRDEGVICVVEDPSDLFAIERSSQYRGGYHVLHGTLAPLDGVGPKDLKVAEQMRQRGEAQLSNPNFVNRAPAEEVERQREVINDLTKRIALLKRNLEGLS